MIRPIRNNVLVKCFKVNECSTGGIIVPENARGDSNKVEVIAVGTGTEKKPMKLKAGDVGFRVKDWGTEVEDNGEKYYLMDASAIIALQ